MLHLNDMLDLIHHMIGGDNVSKTESRHNVLRYDSHQITSPRAYISDPNTDEITAIPSDYGASRSDRAA